MQVYFHERGNNVFGHVMQADSVAIAVDVYFRTFPERIDYMTVFTVPADGMRYTTPIVGF